MTSLRLRYAKGVALGAAVIAWWLAAGQPSGAQGRPAANDELEVLPVQGRVSMLAGAGGNVTVQVGPQGVLLVDTGRADTSAKVLAAVRALSKGPVRYIINTNVDGDHTGGNAALSVAGSPMPGSAQGLSVGAPIIAHENVLNRMDAPTGQPSKVPAEFWPTTTFFTPKKTFAFNDDPIEIIWHPAAHTDGDVLVFFRASDVVSVGDVMNTTAYPMIDLARGGSIQGELDALNRIIDITIPRVNQMGGTRVIPGHGRVCNEADVVEYRDMATVVRDRVKTLIDKRMTLEQVQAARPTYEYDPLYGSDTGPWTTKMFVEAVYQSLSRAAAASSLPAKPAAPKGAPRGK